VRVKGLLNRYPVRRKQVLAHKAQQLSGVQRCLWAYAMAFPHVRIVSQRCVAAPARGGGGERPRYRPFLQKNKSGEDVRDVIRTIFSKSLADELRAFDETAEQPPALRVHGWCARRADSRASAVRAMCNPPSNRPHAEGRCSGRQHLPVRE
jgi:DNA mismatch repair ATPase MutL